MHIDAFGKQCPLPVIMTKKEMDAGEQYISISVDNQTAVDNLTHLGNNRNYEVRVDVIEGGFLVTLKSDTAIASADETAAKLAREIALQAQTLADGAEPTSLSAVGEADAGYAVFLGKEYVGDGDMELGTNLMNMALYTLTEMDNKPAYVLLMNTGVKLAAGDNQQAIENLKTLEAQGVALLVCGTCLNFYGLTDALAVGTVSNMYDILEAASDSSKVISL